MSQPLSSIERGDKTPLLDPSNPPRSSPSIGRTLLWGGVTLIYAGLTGFGIIAAVRRPADNFNLAASIALAAASACACIFCGKKTLESRSVVIVSPLHNDTAARIQEHVLPQINNQLSQVVIKYYPHGERRELGGNIVDQIRENIALIDSLMFTTAEDRDHHKQNLDALCIDDAALDALRIESAALKGKLQLLAAKSPISASSSGAKVTASPSPLRTTGDRANANGSESLVDFDELQRLLEEFDAFKTKVRVSISSASSVRGTPQSRTPAASAPTTPLSSLKTNPVARVSPLNPNSSVNGAGSDDY